MNHIAKEFDDGANKVLRAACQQFILLGEAIDRGAGSEREMYEAIDKIAESFAHARVFVLSGLGFDSEDGVSEALIHEVADSSCRYLPQRDSKHDFPFASAWTSLDLMAGCVPRGGRYKILCGIDLANRLIVEHQSGVERPGLVIDRAAPHEFVFDPISIEALNRICQSSGALSMVDESPWTFDNASANES